MTAKEIFRKLMDTRQSSEEFAYAVVEVGNLKYHSRFGVSQSKRFEVRNQLSELVKEAWINGKGSVDTFFRLCYIADYLELQLINKPNQSKRREKKIATFLFERYQREGCKNLDSYISVMKLI